MARQLRVGVIGTGFGGRVHIPGFMMHPDTTVVAISSSSLEKARSAAQKLGVPHACESAEALIARDDIDLVSITTPPFLHRDMLLAAVAHGKHVLCEKPLALSTQEGREMVSAAQQAGVVAAINHEFRFVPARALFGQLARGGYLGTVHTLEIMNLFPRRPTPQSAPWNWWSEAERGGGVLGAIGSHYIDAARAWLGEVDGVYALLDTYVRERHDPVTNQTRPVTSDDTASLLLRLANGAQAGIRVSSVSAGRLNKVVATGDAGTLMLEDDETLHGALGAGETEQLPIPADLQLLPVEGDRLIAPFLKLVTELAKQVRGEPGEVPSLEDGLRHQEVLDAARRSAREQHWVRIAEVTE